MVVFRNITPAKGSKIIVFITGFPHVSTTPSCPLRSPLDILMFFSNNLNDYRHFVAPHTFILLRLKTFNQTSCSLYKFFVFLQNGAWLLSPLPIIYVHSSQLMEPGLINQTLFQTIQQHYNGNKIALGFNFYLFNIY